MRQEGAEDIVTVTLTVPPSSGALALFQHVSIKRSAGGEPLLPVLWSDNDVTLWPGESLTLTATLAASGAESQGAGRGAGRRGERMERSDPQCPGRREPDVRADRAHAGARTRYHRLDAPLGAVLSNPQRRSRRGPHACGTPCREHCPQVPFHFRDAAIGQHAPRRHPQPEPSVPFGHDQSAGRHHGGGDGGGEQQERLCLRCLRRTTRCHAARPGRELLRGTGGRRRHFRYQPAVVQPDAVVGDPVSGGQGHRLRSPAVLGVGQHGTAGAQATGRPSARCSDSTPTPRCTRGSRR